LPVLSVQAYQKPLIKADSISAGGKINVPEKIKIYPNPVQKSNKITVEIPASREELTLSLYNAVGKVIYTVKSREKRIEIDAPATNGIYLLRFVEKQKVIAVEKIVVKE
jgi:flagellar hook assembly protein FlgD